VTVSVIGAGKRAICWRSSVSGSTRSKGTVTGEEASLAPARGEANL